MRGALCVVAVALLAAVAVRAQTANVAVDGGGSDWMNQWVASGGSMTDLMNMVKGGSTGGSMDGGSTGSVPPMSSHPMKPPMHWDGVSGGVGGEQWHHFHGNGQNDGVDLRPARILLGSSNEMIFFQGTCSPNPCLNGGVCHPRYSAPAAMMMMTTSQVYCSCPIRFSGPRCEYDTCLHAVCKDADSPTLVVPGDVIVECGESTAPNDDGGTGAALATDVCFNVTIGVSDTESPMSPIQRNCPLAETITRTFTAASTCNTTTNGTQIIYVVKQKPPKVRATLSPVPPLAISASQLSLTPDQTIQLLLLAAGVAIDLKEAAKFGALRDLVGGGQGIDVAKGSIFQGLIDRFALDRKGQSTSFSGQSDGLGDMLRSVGLIGGAAPASTASAPVSTPTPAMMNPVKPLLPVGTTIVNVPDNTVDMHGQVVGSGGILSKMDQEVVFAQWLKFGTRLPVGATVCNTPTLRAFRVVCSATDRCTLQTLGTVFTPGTAGGTGSMYGMAANAAAGNMGMGMDMGKHKHMGVGMGNALNATATIVVRRIVGRKSIGFQGINFDPKLAALDADIRRMELDKQRMLLQKDQKFAHDSVLVGSQQNVHNLQTGDLRMAPLATTSTSGSTSGSGSGSGYASGSAGASGSISGNGAFNGAGSAMNSAMNQMTGIAQQFVSGSGSRITDEDVLNSQEFANRNTGATVLAAQCQTRVDTVEVPCGSVVVIKLDAEDACLQDDFLADSPWHLERMFVRSDFESDPFAGDVNAWKGKTSFGAHLFRGTDVSLRVSVSDVCANTGHDFDDPARTCETFVAGVCCPPITNALTQFDLSQIRGDPRPQAQELLTAAVQKLNDKLPVGGGIGSVVANPGIQQASDQLRNLFGNTGNIGNVGNTGNFGNFGNGGYGGNVGSGGYGGGVGGPAPVPMMPMRP